MADKPSIKRINLPRPDQPPPDSKVSAADGLTEPIGNHLIEAEYSVLFGTGYESSAEKLKGEIPKSLDAIIIEHADADHYGATSELRQYLDAVTVAAPIGDRETFEEINLGIDLYLEDAVEYWGFEAVEIPGHTPGNMSFVYSDQSILIVGDSFISSKDPLRANGNWSGAFAPIGAEWCTDFESACHNLNKLTEYTFDTALLTHGEDEYENAYGEFEKLVSDLNQTGLG